MHAPSQTRARATRHEKRNEQTVNTAGEENARDGDGADKRGRAKQQRHCGKTCRGMEMGLTNEVEPNSSVDGSAKIREKHLNSSRRTLFVVGKMFLPPCSRQVLFKRFSLHLGHLGVQVPLEHVESCTRRQKGRIGACQCSAAEEQTTATYTVQSCGQSNVHTRSVAGA